MRSPLDLGFSVFLGLEMLLPLPEAEGAGLCVVLVFSVFDYCWSFKNPEILKNEQACSF